MMGLWHRLLKVYFISLAIAHPSMLSLHFVFGIRPSLQPRSDHPVAVQPHLSPQAFAMATSPSPRRASIACKSFRRGSTFFAPAPYLKGSFGFGHSPLQGTTKRSIESMFLRRSSTWYAIVWSLLSIRVFGALSENCWAANMLAGNAGFW